MNEFHSSASSTLWGSFSGSFVLRHFGGYGTRLVRARKAQLYTVRHSLHRISRFRARPLYLLAVGRCSRFTPFGRVSGRWVLIFQRRCQWALDLRRGLHGLFNTDDFSDCGRYGFTCGTHWAVGAVGSRSSRRLSRPLVSLRPRESGADGSLGSLSVAPVGSWSTG